MSQFEEIAAQKTELRGDDQVFQSSWTIAQVSRYIVPTFSVVFLVIAAWSFVWQRIESDREQARLGVSDNINNVAVTMAHNISRISGELDSLLQFMRAIKRSKSIETPWQDVVTEDFTLNRHTVQIAIIAADGMMVTSTKMLHPPKPVDLSDREHYRIHLGSSSDELFISKPVLGRASNRWSVQYTRPLFTSSGEFDGAIVVSLDPSKLTQVYGALDLGGQGGVAIVGDDNIIRAGTGSFANKLGRELDSLLLNEKQLQVGSNSEAVAIDDTISISRAVEGYPLRVIVQAADPWAAQGVRLATPYVGGGIVFTALAFFVFIMSTRARLREQALMDEQNRFEVEKTVAEESSRAKGEFLAVMSHEIRTPLNGVLGALELLQLEKMSVAADKNLELATSSGEHLLSLIDDILIYSKLEQGELKLEPSSYNLVRFANELKMMIDPLAHKSKNKFTVEIPANLNESFKFDSVRLRQVLLNLIGNANKFTRAGSVKLTVREIETNGHNPTIRFAVEDTGVGIPLDKQKTIFEKFNSLDSSFSRRTDGTGLGLAISLKIVQAMGGNIELASEYGVGSCFSFQIQLPRCDEEIIAAPTRPKTCSSAERNLNILMAEDNPTNAYITKQFLIEDGHAVTHVEDGLAAVDASNSDPFDIILMDISMPNMDGLTAAAMIRESGGLNASTPIIALTAHAIQGTKERIEASGMDDYVTKPIRRVTLLETLARLSDPKVDTAALIAPVESDDDRVTEEPSLASAIDFFFASRSSDHASALAKVFVLEMEARRRALLKGLDERDAELIGQTTHAICGSTSMLGAQDIANQCRVIEEEIQLENTFADAAVRRVIEEIDQLIVLVKPRMSDEYHCSDAQLSECA